MLFPSPEFLCIFLPIAIIGFHLLGRIGRVAAMGWLAFVSVVFYASWRVDYVPLLLSSILFNYICAVAIHNTSRRPSLQLAIMIVGIMGDLGVLVFYKYLFPSLNALHSAGLMNHAWPSLLLPLGISFFTFTQIGYLVDLREGTAESHNFPSYVLFVTFFPHLIAGPILHHKEMMPQFSQERRYGIDACDFDIGLSWFLLGLAKKLLLADTIARVADPMFAHPFGVSFVTSWSAVIAYALQLYFDFSGYSDMAIGLARMFSIHFPVNFNSPYKARNIIDFWQRFHMTLTRYITLYLYNPISLWMTRRRVAAGMATSRKALATPGGFSSMIALPSIFTMFLAGAWHGAGFKFLIFGLLHGCYITINHLWRIIGPKLGKAAPAWMKNVSLVSGVALTFTSVIVAQVFFRADSTRAALAVIAGMAGFNGFGGWMAIPAAWPWSLEITLAIITGMLLIVWIAPNTQQLMSSYPNMRISRTLKAAVYGILAYIVLFHSSTQPFIYFQF